MRPKRCWNGWRASNLSDLDEKIDDFKLKETLRKSISLWICLGSDHSCGGCKVDVIRNSSGKASRNLNITRYQEISRHNTEPRRWSLLSPRNSFFWCLMFHGGSEAMVNTLIDAKAESWSKWPKSIEHHRTQKSWVQGKSKIRDADNVGEKLGRESAAFGFWYFWFEHKGIKRFWGRWMTWASGCEWTLLHGFYQPGDVDGLAAV